MKIIQIVNNNVALIKKGGNEVFIVSKGIGFKKKKGEYIEENDIEKMYILDTFEMLEHFSYLLSKSEPNDILLINNIINNAENRLKIKTTDYLALTLLDHINYLIDRAKKKQFISSPLVWNVKRFYPLHFEVGIQSLNMITKEKNIKFPIDEAVSIALHFVNNDIENNAKSIRQTELRTLSDIVSIIEKHFKVKLDENSTNFMRFSTHLQYFIQRVVQNDSIQNDNDIVGLYKQISQLYPESFKVVQKIKIYIESEFQIKVTINEETYMMMHITRLTERICD